MTQNKTLGAMNIGLIIGVVIVAVIGIFLLNQSDTPTSNAVSTETSNDVASADDNQTNEVELTNGDLEESASDLSSAALEAPVATGNGVYTDYDPALIANADNGPVLLSFYASWCPSCRFLDNDVKKNIADLPPNVTILQVNYDTATDLKKKYGVVRQHTLVQIDANGDEIKTLTGLTNTLDQVLAQI